MQDRCLNTLLNYEKLVLSYEVEYIPPKDLNDVTMLSNTICDYVMVH